MRQKNTLKLKSLNKIGIAARNKENYLKTKEAFNNKRVDECILFYAPNHEVKSKQSEKGRAGIQRFLKGLHETWPDVQITIEHVVAEDITKKLPQLLGLAPF
jgi:hypothetical protein